MLRSLQRKPPTVAPKVGIVLASERDRASAVVETCRSRLQEIAHAETINAIKTKMVRFGGLEGLGLHLRMASIRLEQDDSESSEFKRLLAEGEKLSELIQNVNLNFTVLLSLFLTIYITLSVLHAGQLAYSVADSSLADAHVERFGRISESRPWTDLATLASTEGEAQQGLRRGLYVGECVSLALGTLICSCGLIESMCQYSTWGAGLPSILARIELLFERPQVLVKPWLYFDGSLLLLLLAISFVAARASAIASLCGFSAFAFLFYSICSSTFYSSGQLVLAQTREARRILEEVQSRSASSTYCAT